MTSGTRDKLSDLLSKLKADNNEAVNMCRYYGKLMESYAQESQRLESAIPSLEATINALGGSK